MEPISRSVEVTRAAARVSGLAHMEARRLGHHYLGPEHLLVGLLVEGDNLAARVLVANGLDLAHRPGRDRPPDRPGRAPGAPAQRRRAAGQPGRRPGGGPQPAPGDLTPHIRTDPTPLVCGRAMGFAAHEAIARDQDVGPEHLLLGLLREAEEPIGTDLPAQSLRERVLLGLPDHGPHPIKLLVEGQGLTLGELQAGVLERGT
jgi:Clp amino terminal domain, pathogenicity island component